jgi:hypothetical protein
VSDYRVEVTSAALARHLAATLLDSAAGGKLPGLVLHVGGGWLQLDERAMDSLRGRLVVTRAPGHAEVLRIGGDTWDVLPI